MDSKADDESEFNYMSMDEQRRDDSEMIDKAVRLDHNSPRSNSSGLSVCAQVSSVVESGPLSRFISALTGLLAAGAGPGPSSEAALMNVPSGLQAAATIAIGKFMVRQLRPSSKQSLRYASSLMIDS